MASISRFPVDRFCQPKEVGYDVCQDVECGDKDSYEETLADSTTLLHWMWEADRPAPHGGSEGERR